MQLFLSSQRALSAHIQALSLRLMLAVWVVIAIYSGIYAYLDARFSFFVVAIGTFLLSPIYFALELRGHARSARILFIISCNLYILGTSLGLAGRVSAEYYYTAAMMLPFLLFDDEKRFQIFLCILFTSACWYASTIGHPFDLPFEWVFLGGPTKTLRALNFLGAFLITIVFLRLFLSTQSFLKELLFASLKAEAESLKKSNELLMESQSIAKIGSWRFDLLTKKQTWSSEHYRIFEIAEPQTDDVLFKMYRDRIHPEDLDHLDHVLDRALKKGEDFVYNHRVYLDGGRRIKHVRGIGRVGKNEFGDPVSVAGTCQDVTDLVNLRDQNRFILDSMGIGIWQYDPLTQSLAWDESMYKIFEVNPVAFDGSYSFWEQTLSQAGKEKVIDELQKALRGEKEFNTTYEICTGRGAKRFIGGRGIVVRNDRGEPVMMYGINWDRTKDIELEERVLQEQAKSLQAAKLASLGEISASIAHEINNPLAVLMGNSLLLPKFKDDNEKFKAKVDSILKSGARIKKIVEALRKYSRTSEKSVLKVEKLSSIISEAQAMMELKSKQYHVPISININDDVAIECDSVEIEQVAINLLSNAIDAVKGSVERWVRVEVSQRGDLAILRVLDSGGGIPVEVVQRLFQPFFTTKPVGEGTGLGLSIVKGILDQHKATITVDRTCPNTCFEIAFRVSKTDDNRLDKSNAA